MQTLNLYVCVCMCACALCVQKMFFGLHYYVGAVASVHPFLSIKKWVKCRILTIKYSIRD